MITIETNLGEVLNDLSARLTSVETNRLTRIQATTLMAEIRQRVHVRGQAADGRDIGTYSPRFLPVRQRWHRTEGSRVVVSLSRAMENAMVIIPLSDGTGIGYATARELEKARHAERYWGRPLFRPSEEELRLMRQIAVDYVNGIMQR